MINNFQNSFLFLRRTYSSFNNTANLSVIQGALGTVKIDLAKFDKKGIYSLKETKSENKEFQSEAIFYNQTIDYPNDSNRMISQKNNHHLDRFQSLQLQFFHNSPVSSSSHEMNPHFNTRAKKDSFSLPNFYSQKKKGTSYGHFVYLRIVGIGFRVFLEKNTLIFKVGLSHLVKFELSPGVFGAFLPEPTLICLYGVDKNEITQLAASIRDIRAPSTYKGKGIRIVNKPIIIKATKKSSK